MYSIHVVTFRILAAHNIKVYVTLSSIHNNNTVIIHHNSTKYLNKSNTNEFDFARKKNHS